MKKQYSKYDIALRKHISLTKSKAHFKNVPFDEVSAKQDFEREVEKVKAQIRDYNKGRKSGRIFQSAHGYGGLQADVNVYDVAYRNLNDFESSFTKFIESESEQTFDYHMGRFDGWLGQWGEAKFDSNNPRYNEFNGLTWGEISELVESGDLELYRFSNLVEEFKHSKRWLEREYKTVRYRPKRRK